MRLSRNGSVNFDESQGELDPDRAKGLFWIDDHEARSRSRVSAGFKTG